SSSRGVALGGARLRKSGTSARRSMWIARRSQTKSASTPRKSSRRSTKRSDHLVTIDASRSSGRWPLMASYALRTRDGAKCFQVSKPIINGGASHVQQEASAAFVREENFSWTTATDGSQIVGTHQSLGLDLEIGSN